MQETIEAQKREQEEVIHYSVMHLPRRTTQQSTADLQQCPVINII